MSSWRLGQGQEEVQHRRPYKARAGATGCTTDSEGADSSVHYSP